MKIIIGSKNQVKVAAVMEVVPLYPQLIAAEIESIEVDTGVGAQPMTLEETTQGAINRARACLEHGEIGIGLESGLMQLPQSKSGELDVCVCAVAYGDDIYLGLSSAWECPASISALMKSEGINMAAAALKAGYTSNPKLGSAEGLIGVLTKGRVDRKEYTKQALLTAFIHLEQALEK